MGHHVAVTVECFRIDLAFDRLDASPFDTKSNVGDTHAGDEAQVVMEVRSEAVAVA